jgi:acetyl-CoA acetyltransferase
MDPQPFIDISRNFYAPYGIRSAVQWYSFYLQRYVDTYRVEPTDAARIALACRQHAQLNEKALMRGRPMTLDDYLTSPPIAGPVRKLDCCLETDCAAAVVLSATSRPIAQRDVLMIEAPFGGSKRAIMGPVVEGFNCARLGRWWSVLDAWCLVLGSWSVPSP